MNYMNANDSMKIKKGLTSSWPSYRVRPAVDFREVSISAWSKEMVHCTNVHVNKSKKPIPKNPLFLNCMCLLLINYNFVSMNSKFHSEVMQSAPSQRIFIHSLLR